MGKGGIDFIKELTRKIKLFTMPTKWSRLALAKAHIFIPLMLQKPSARSKVTVHAKYLTRRLEPWNTGDLDSILKQNCEIQNRLRKSQDSKKRIKGESFL